MERMTDVKIHPVSYWIQTENASGLCRGTNVTYSRGDQRASARLPWIVATAAEAVQYIEQMTRGAER